MSIQKWNVTEPYLDIKCGLGEGPFYSEDRNELRFVDIWNHKLHTIDLSKGPESLKTVDTGMPVGVTADIEGTDEVILTGAKDGITKFSPHTGHHEYIAKLWTEEEGPEKAKRMRCNDGAVDSAGRFWVGTMNDPKVTAPTDEGVLFCLDPDGKLHRMLSKMTIPNGISWNNKNDTMYLTDTATHNVYAFDFDPGTGKISNQRVFFHLDEGGDPDGHVRDVDDCIWHACYSGSRVIRISPEGTIIGEVSIPTRNPTCPVFVGTELFITTAKEDDPEQYPESAKYAGSLFRVDVRVRGQAQHNARFQQKS